MPRVDHVVYGVHDLDQAAARLADEFGLHAEAGGEHPGFGTANRILGLGDTYLELLAGPPVTALLGDGPDRLLGWMVQSEDLDADAARLGIGVLDMTRTRPDGVELRWRLAGWGLGGPLPVFIQWDTPWDRGGDARLAWMEVAVSPPALRDWVGSDDEIRVRYTEGDGGLDAIGILLPDGREVVLR
jgi:hypothetical protein